MATPSAVNFDGDPAQLRVLEGAWWVKTPPLRSCRLLRQLRKRDDLCRTGWQNRPAIASGATSPSTATATADRLRRNQSGLICQPISSCRTGVILIPNPRVDAILLDAPVPAPGTIRRRPDILGRAAMPTKPSFNHSMGLATTALGWLKPGGK
ncbi:MAG: hypothetical protein CM15mP46_1970 [Alphaproteobacteria bacterium]|nr:MAG: hypothetical protein CM15mP46_1970 [Alphaproteobacteria bacterium]